MHDHIGGRKWKRQRRRDRFIGHYWKGENREQNPRCVRRVKKWVIPSQSNIFLLSLVLHRPDPTYFNYSLSFFPTACFPNFQYLIIHHSLTFFLGWLSSLTWSIKYTLCSAIHAMAEKCPSRKYRLHPNSGVPSEWKCFKLFFVCLFKNAFFPKICHTDQVSLHYVEEKLRLHGNWLHSLLKASQGKTALAQRSSWGKHRTTIGTYQTVISCCVPDPLAGPDLFFINTDVQQKQNCCNDPDRAGGRRGQEQLQGELQLDLQMKERVKSQWWSMMVGHFLF